MLALLLSGMGWAKTAVLLLKHGADALLANGEAKTALGVAREAKYPKVVKVLEEVAADGVDAVVHKYRDEL
jgi:hypothetical protein